MRVLGIEGTAWMASAAVFDTETVEPRAAGDDRIEEFHDRYTPDDGGIHPREAAEHMGDAVPGVVGDALAFARETPRLDGRETPLCLDDAPFDADGDESAAAASASEASSVERGVASDAADATGDGNTDTGGDAADATDDRNADAAVDAVAFSRGPGLGPCLRIVGTAARALATELGVPLVGVNHMLAHLEIGRHRSGFDRPVCLNASGANAHLLAYRAGRYRVLGETMDTGVGNTLDKFARSLDWGHPGGPKVERAAADGDYHELPYVVKGMDFSFAGLASAASAAVADGASVPDVCAGLQEHVFGALTEVSERALALTDADELVVGGGVGQNDRLREMLATMCDQRGASLYAPESRFLRDNASMIAVLGAKMAAVGDTVAVADSAVDPGFRPDEVPVTWRDRQPERVARGLRRPAADTADAANATTEPETSEGVDTAEAATAAETTSATEGLDPTSVPSVASDSGVTSGVEAANAVRGAEATVTVTDGEVVKRRPPKSYRHPTLDDRLRRERTVAEARLLAAARRQGVPTPLVREVDTREATLRLSFVGDRELGAVPTVDRVRRVGSHLARLHAAGIVHGDPTTRNVRVDTEPGTDEPGRVYLLDFGLGYHADHVENLAMDLHVFAGSLRGTVADADRFTAAFERAYRETRESVPVERPVAGTDDPLDRLREIENRGRYR